MSNNSINLIAIRAAEEIQEQGSIEAAITAVERQIASPDSIKAERIFMRKVLSHLKGTK